MTTQLIWELLMEQIDGDRAAGPPTFKPASRNRPPARDNVALEASCKIRVCRPMLCSAAILRPSGGTGVAHVRTSSAHLRLSCASAGLGAVSFFRHSVAMGNTRHINRFCHNHFTFTAAKQ